MPSSPTSTGAAAGLAASIKALTFDVFGTVVDWREQHHPRGRGASAGPAGINIDWARFADAWRGRYQPQLDEVRTGAVPWTKLDDLHRESLDQLLAEFGITRLDRGRRPTTSTARGTGSIPGPTRCRGSPGSGAASSWPRSPTATSPSS